MAFPQTPLPVYVDIAPGASPEASVDTWDPLWTDITDDVRVGQGIEVEEGIPDEANQADPGSCVLTLDNRSGDYSPRNPLGQWYASLAKNTPLRVRLERGRDSFARTRATGTGWGTSDSGIAWTNTASLGTDGTRGYFTASTTTTATNAGTWDFDMTTGIAVDILPGLGNYKIFIINFRYTSSTDKYLLRLDFNPDNTMGFYLQRVIGGSTTTIIGISNLAAVAPLTAATRYNVRLKAEGGFIGAKVWNAAGSEPSTWSGSTSTQSTYTLDNSNFGTGLQLQVGQAGTPATTLAYWYPIVINSYPFIGTVPEWPVRWDKSGNDSTAPLKAAGVLRRLQQGATPLRSPLYPYLDSLDPSAMWLLEDESGATLAAAATPGTKGATIYSTSPSGWDGPPKLAGTSGQYTVGTDTTISGVVPRMTPAGAWLAWFAFYMPVLPVTNPTIFRVRASGTVSQWDLKISDDFGGVAYLVGKAPDGTTLVNVSVVYTPGRWAIGQIEIQQTGGNFTGRIVNYDIESGTVAGATSGSIAGSIGVPQGWSIYGQTGFQDGAAGPVAFFPYIPSVTVSALLSAARGFVDEDAGDRIARLCAERNVRLDLLTGGGDTPMGPQTADTLLALLGEAATTDLGLLTEFRGGLRYRSRGRRFYQNSGMTLDFDLGQVAEPPEPTDDDQRLRNDVTVTRKNGGSARAFDSLSIALNGAYDTSVQINPSTDDVLPGHASFRLYLSTWDEVRWPSITINLAKHYATAGFVERATALEPGSYIVVNNPPDNLPIGPLHLLVEAISHTFGPYEWKMELTCSPYGPWRIPKTGVTAAPRMDLVGSTLGSAETASTVGATDTWTITNSGNSWNSAALPFNWEVAGEVVTVTALSGTSSQTATVTRGVNGIVKSHAIGEEVHLETIFYVAL